MTADTIEAEAEALRLALVDELTASGALRSPQWRHAFLTAPRHHFTPTFFRYGRAGLERYSPASPGWLSAIYQDEALTTQLTTGIPTSSSSQPSLIARMLEALDVEDGMRVLEIGTGTGYSAALLSYRLGARNVVTVDVDPSLVAAAVTRLAELGLEPDVYVGDGAAGHSGGGPFDRIMATCSVRSIPLAWQEQLTPGGRILVTLSTGLHGYALAELGADGCGRILPIEASFMPMRSHADPAFVTLQALAGPSVMAGTTEHPGIGNGERFVLGLSLPEVVAFGLPDGKIPGTYLSHRSDGSWAHALADGRLSQGGPQRLWDQLEAAREAWRAEGAPRPDSFQVNVDRKLQRVHTPDDRLSYELPEFVWQWSARPDE
ncbi:protein-L-isoaspartate(D-aspartate) O-methyltransferase [Streptacidiphilus sp. MAP12-20]|uniref:methyltransferase domain-containing protein n=1 Tax=Streptacidiphilus sp. MAP12-20 TaxID=3156299 RepID=UPI003514AD60